MTLDMNDGVDPDYEWFLRDDPSLDGKSLDMSKFDNGVDTGTGKDAASKCDKGIYTGTGNKGKDDKDASKLDNGRGDKGNDNDAGKCNRATNDKGKDAPTNDVDADVGLLEKDMPPSYKRRRLTESDFVTRRRRNGSIAREWRWKDPFPTDLTDSELELLIE